MISSEVGLTFEPGLSFPLCYYHSVATVPFRLYSLNYMPGISHALSDMHPIILLVYGCILQLLPRVKPHPRRIYGCISSSVYPIQMTLVPCPPLALAVNRGSDSELDLFADIPSENEGEKPLHFEDFFDPPSEECGSGRGDSDSVGEEWESEEQEEDGEEDEGVKDEGVEDEEQDKAGGSGEAQGEGGLSSHEKHQLQVSSSSSKASALLLCQQLKQCLLLVLLCLLKGVPGILLKSVASDLGFFLKLQQCLTSVCIVTPSSSV